MSVIRIERDDLVFYQFEQWQFDSLENAPFTHGIFTRKGGVSQPPFASLNLGGNIGDDPAAVRENHIRMYRALGVDEASVCSVWQIHSDLVLSVSQPPPDRHWIDRADGMITQTRGTTLSMRFADCTPILFYDPTRGVIGMAHAGWRGTVQGIAAKTVTAMTAQFGCRPADIQAGIGPSIGPKTYQVGEEVVDAVIAYFGDAKGLIARDADDGTPYFDLWTANRRDLERAGVQQIEVAGISTASHPDEWFSHRGEHGKTGRFGGVMSL